MHGSIPKVDPFTFTRSGVAWIDFEWGFQLLLYPFGLLGDWGLWTAKALLLALAFLPIDGLLRDRMASSLERALGAALWAAAILPKADLRADLVSAALFAWQLRRVASGRASFFSGFLMFSIWANLHAGFVVGLALYPAWALIQRTVCKPADLSAEACGAALGTLLNPYGFSLYTVFATHVFDPVRISVTEWGAFSLSYPFQWPFAAVLAVGVRAAWRARRREPCLAYISLALSMATLFSVRFNVYWPVAAVPLMVAVIPAEAALAVLSVLFAASLHSVDWGRPYQDIFVARSAVDFIVAERAVFAPLRVFNTYEWGGYLGWRLGPQGRVYGDGRYLFHAQLAELQEALSGAVPMAAFVARNRLDALLIRNYQGSIHGERVYPDGTRRKLRRPWYVSYLPRERWALVWWNSQALIFVERIKVETSWLVAHEYRWWRPGDTEALADALARGEVSASTVDSEKLRHGR